MMMMMNPLSPPPQGAPESILERCAYVRVNGTEKVSMTEDIKDQIMEVIQRYGTGKGVKGDRIHVH